MPNRQNRVLCRQLARNLTAEELDMTSGGAPITTPLPGGPPDATTTFCTAFPHRDGDDD